MSEIADVVMGSLLILGIVFVAWAYRDRHLERENRWLVASVLLSLTLMGCFAAIASSKRYEIVSASGGLVAYKLDRWTGRVWLERGAGSAGEVEVTGRVTLP